MKIPNPIDEIKRIRHQLGADVGYDIHRIFADLRATQASSGRSYIHPQTRHIAADQTMERRGDDDISRSENPTPITR